MKKQCVAAPVAKKLVKKSDQLFMVLLFQWNLLLHFSYLIYFKEGKDKADCWIFSLCCFGFSQSFSTILFSRNSYFSLDIFQISIFSKQVKEFNWIVFFKANYWRFLAYEVIYFDFEIEANQRSREIELSKIKTNSKKVKESLKKRNKSFLKILLGNLYFLRPYPNDFHQLR